MALAMSSFFKYNEQTMIHIKDIEKALSDINCCMMSTIDENGQINSRPMLHNKTIGYNDGNLYFFSMKDTRKVRDIKENPTISLTYQNTENTLFIQVHGKAKLCEKPEEMAPYWDKQLDLWWSQRENTPQICMIHIHVSWIRYWSQGKDCTIEP